MKGIINKAYSGNEKKRRTALDKLRTLMFGKDLRITEGEPYTEIREYDFSSYYPEESYIRNQSVPDKNVFDIRDFGACTDNEDNARFIGLAIEKAGTAGGTVLVSGGDFVSSEIALKSGVTLFIEKDSSITANKSGKGYESHGALLYAENAENITLTGGGKIRGNGHLFGRRPELDKNITSPAEYIDVVEMRRAYRSQLRFAHPSKYGGVIAFNNCRGVSVDNFIIENSAHWSFKLVNCEQVSIKNFIVNNNRNVANADGIDIAGCSNADISHCFISTSDDGIVIKNALWLGNRGAMKNIKIKDCEIISRTNSIKVGTETTFDISDIEITDCRLFMTDLYPGTVSGIALEACDGTKLSDVRVNNIEMNRCTCPVFVRLGNRNRASSVSSLTANAIEFAKKVKSKPAADKHTFDMKSEISNITIKNINACGVEIPIILAGFRQRGKTKRIRNICLENICLSYADIPETKDRRLFIPEYAAVYPESWRFRNLNAYSLWARHVENLSIKNLSCLHPRETWKKEIVKKDVK